MHCFSSYITQLCFSFEYGTLDSVTWQSPLLQRKWLKSHTDIENKQGSQSPCCHVSGRERHVSHKQKLLCPGSSSSGEKNNPPSTMGFSSALRVPSILIYPVVVVIMRLEFFDGVFTNMCSEAFQVSPRKRFLCYSICSLHIQHTTVILMSHTSSDTDLTVTGKSGYSI